MEIPRTLAECLRTGKIVPFVGAGVSMAVRHKETHTPLFPSCKQLLERAAQRLEEDRQGVRAGSDPSATPCCWSGGSNGREEVYPHAPPAEFSFLWQ